MKPTNKTLEQLIQNSENALLIVVDGQVDFASGVLGSPDAYAALKRAVPFIKAFKGTKAYTKDTHYEATYLKTEEGKHLPVPHTIKNTEGWELVPELKELFDPENDLLFEKDTFGSRRLAAWLDRNPNRFTDVYLIGLDTGYCVISNTILAKTYCPDTPVHVIANYCCCATEASHKTALEAMWTLHVDIIHVQEDA